MVPPARSARQGAAVTIASSLASVMNCEKDGILRFGPCYNLAATGESAQHRSELREILRGSGTFILPRECLQFVIADQIDALPVQDVPCFR